MIGPDGNAAAFLLDAGHFQIRSEVVAKVEAVVAGSAEIIHDDPRVWRNKQETAAVDDAFRQPQIAVMFSLGILDAGQREAGGSATAVLGRSSNAPG